ncbi:MAG: transglycosylase domain-containing protein [bacterium]
MSEFRRRNNDWFRIAVFIVGCIGPGMFLYAIGDTALFSPLPTRVVHDGNGAYICEIRNGDDKAEAGYWPVEPIPHRIAATIKVMEDRRFGYHFGVDPLAILRAVKQNILGGRRVSGASTLAMQVARLQRPAERTVPNKIREMMTAVFLTMRYGRSGIMDHYLRLAPYGNGIRGIGYASYCYFGKPVEDLSWAEIAFLSAVPQQPNRMNPRTSAGRTRLVRRARQIIDAVHKAGYITDNEAARARKQVAEIRLQPRLTQQPETIHIALRIREILRDPKMRDTIDGTIIQTALDQKIQRKIAEQAQLCVDSWSKSGVENAAVMVVNVRTGEVVASLGSTDYFDADRAGAIDYTRVKRSPGSTLKPFIYALAMENGVISPDSMIIDHVTHAGGFGNFDGVWLGEIPVRRALASSRNVPAVDLIRQTGLHRTFGHLADLRLHSHEKEAAIHGLGIAVGGLPVTMERLVQAYTVFSSKGVLRDLQWFQGQKRLAPQKIFSGETVQWINRSLSDPMARLPSFPRMGYLEYEYPVAVKTGTSEGSRDAWAIAWSSEYLTAVWLGRPDGRPMHRVGGYQTAAPLARVIMDELHKNPLSEIGWKGTALDIGKYGYDDTEKAVAAIQSPDHFVPNTWLAPQHRRRGIQIISPESESVYTFDPDMPLEYSTIQFTAISDQNLSSLTWEVDGIPFATTDYPWSTYWQLKPGTHRIRAIAPVEGIESPVTVIHVERPGRVYDWGPRDS